MSKIEVTLKDEILTIQKKTSRENPKDTEQIQVNILEYDKEYTSTIKVSNDEYRNKVLLIKEINKNGDKNQKGTEPASQKEVVVVYSQNKKIRYSYCSLEKAYKKLVRLRYKVINISLSKRKLKIKILSYIINPYNIEIKDTKFYIDELLYQTCELKQYPSKISKLKMIEDKNIYRFKFDVKDIIKDDSLINGKIRFGLHINGEDIDYQVGIANKKMKNSRYYYAPIRSKFVGDYALHIRRTPKGNLILVNRLKEPIENTVKFRFMESKIVSNLLYGISKILIPIRRRKINLFYEKFSSKAEEGVYDLFLLAKQRKQYKNYFVIDKNSPDYEKIKSDKNVVKKYSLKYYWLVFNASNFISTEAPIHLNIIRSNNGPLRKSTVDKKFIFLQHGITYLKCQGDGSTFGKGKEGESTYIIVGSEKEKDVVSDMLHLEEEQILKTGLPIFSKIKYNHINNDSDDIVTIMLTWKPYEEQLYNFEESSYYQNVVKIYNMLTKYIDKSKIIIIGHPKANLLLSQTDLGSSLWEKPSSKALEKTKLLITDYSSVCYNAFYQGAGVIFYQDDLERYELVNGALIPRDDEYIGKRIFEYGELENLIKGTIVKDKIDLSKVRTKEFEDNYKTINEFTDGKNIERIYNELIKLKLV